MKKYLSQLLTHCHQRKLQFSAESLFFLNDCNPATFFFMRPVTVHSQNSPLKIRFLIVRISRDYFFKLTPGYLRNKIKMIPFKQTELNPELSHWTRILQIRHCKKQNGSGELVLSTPPLGVSRYPEIRRFELSAEIDYPVFISVRESPMSLTYHPFPIRTVLMSQRPQRDLSGFRL